MISLILKKTIRETKANNICMSKKKVSINRVPIIAFYKLCDLVKYLIFLFLIFKIGIVITNKYIYIVIIFIIPTLLILEKSQ